MHYLRSCSLTTLILLPTIFTFRIIAALNIFCDYSMQNFTLLTKNSIYTCTVADIKKVTEPGLEIVSVYGQHFNGSKDENVHSIKFEGKTVNFFPKRLDRFFAFLSVISLISSNLTVIKQDDLTPYTNLRFLDLHDNLLDYLSRDLFVYNPNLEIVNLSLNQITNIDPDVFDYLNSLRYLNLENNECISDMENDRNGVKALITEIKEKCNNCDFELQKNLENSIKNMKNSYISKYDELRAEIDMLRAQNFDITKRAQFLNGNLSNEIDKLTIKLAERKASSNRTIFLLKLMLVIMCSLLVIFAVVIICFILNNKCNEEQRTPEIVEYLPRYDENVIVKRTNRQKRLSENLYEDINGSLYVVESAYDRLQHF
ncbi:relaxin receptor 2-like [Chironomus tepperi]|uniref:relaxin receptor 2-like n=1 Tax=Chironomus tepperi TaxID=113505 RepID=UPI00391EE5E5